MPEGQTPSPQPAARVPLTARLRQAFLTGLILVLPVYITIWAVVRAVTEIDSIAKALAPLGLLPWLERMEGVPGLGLVMFVGVVTLAGLAVRSLAGRALHAWSDRMIDRLPVVRTIHAALRQLAETLFTRDDGFFRAVCLIPYPYPGRWAVAFSTSVTAAEIRRLTDDDTVTVFMPTAPNPTTGFTFVLPRREIVLLDMSIDDGFKIVISGGLVVPDAPPPPQARV
ncbi:MAG TPA: DUF502 domain-containing protein [Paracoccaceae bacterium]|nr:DUF502 domain-containing protein [Paracoccaceae bacterium]